MNKITHTLFIIVFLFAANILHSQKLYILRFGTGGCINECAALESYYFMSNNTVVEPIGGYDGCLIFDKPPTYVELITIADTGFGCAWRDPMACNTRSNIDINNCGWGMSNEVLSEPNAITNSFCDKITLKAGGCPGTQRYSWEYSTDGTNYNKVNATTGVNQNYDFIKANHLPNNYSGNVFFRVLIDSDPNFTEENIYSNVVNYKVTSCSPLLDGPPIAAKVKCYNESNGSVTLKFLTDISDSQKLLLNLYQGSDFKYHKFANSIEIANKTFTWDKLPQGTYTIKYQTQSNSDNSTAVGSLPIISPSFTIENVQPLTFKSTAIQPACSTDKGAILITASGGTPPYYYMLDNETLANKHPFTSPYTIPDLSDGGHKVIVVDNNNCIEK